MTHYGEKAVKGRCCFNMRTASPGVGTTPFLPSSTSLHPALSTSHNPAWPGKGPSSGYNSGPLVTRVNPPLPFPRTRPSLNPGVSRLLTCCLMLYAYLPPGSSDPSGAFRCGLSGRVCPAWRHVWYLDPWAPCSEPSPASSSLYSRVLTVGFTVGPILFYSTQSRPTLSACSACLAHILMY